MSSAAALRTLDRVGAAVATVPGRFCLFVLVLTTAGLAIDQVVDLPGQLALSAAVWVVLLWAFRYLTPMERAQTTVVVLVATIAEILGSVILGVYEYRLGNLPLFVSPGHGLVYLTGLRLSQTRWAVANRRVFMGVVVVGIVSWAVLGLIALGRTDVAGAIGATVLLVFLWRGRAPAVYAGVFIVVAYLEIYGTAVGTWRWAEHIPYLGLPDGNPPSGAASGYVLFDIAALAFAPSLLRLAASVRRRWRARRAGQPQVPQAAFSDQS